MIMHRIIRAVIRRLKTRIRELIKYFKSRDLFVNWIYAIISYILIKMRLSRGCIKVKCRSGGEACISPLLYSITCKFHAYGGLINVKCDKDSIIINGLRLKLELTNNLNLGAAVFKNYHWPIIEVFFSQDYGIVDAKDRVVVDVGAFVGDSSIYFVLRGARRVYAIEPHPGAYAEMLENIKLNNMEDKIIPINAALGSKPGKIKIPNISLDATARIRHKAGVIGYFEVPQVTLRQLIMSYSIEPDVLKMDCEGCEYDIILNDYDDVRLFRELVFELHKDKGPWVELLRKLTNDFKCVETRAEGNLAIVHCTRIKLP